MTVMTSLFVYFTHLHTNTSQVFYIIRHYYVMICRSTPLHQEGQGRAISLTYIRSKAIEPASTVKLL